MGLFFAKTLFLEEIARLPRSSYIATGGRTSEAGLASRLYVDRPRYCIIDEIADMNPDAFSVLKPVMESGRLDETISGGREPIQLDVRILGSTARPQKLPYEIRSRFVSVHFRRYEREEFLEIAKKYLLMRGDVADEGLASYVADELGKTWAAMCARPDQ